MTDQTVTPIEPIDQPEAPEDAAKRAAFVADLRTFADWLEATPWAPLPYDAEASYQLNSPNDRASVAPCLARLREIAARTGGTIGENLSDRTRLVVKYGRVKYNLLVWHPNGRPGERDSRDVELERLRAEVAELRAAVPAGALDGDTGLLYSRADDADDPTPVSPARVPLHTGAMTDGGLVDETEVPPRAGVVEVAGGRVVHECCGKLDDAEHRNFCKKYVRPALLDAHRAALDEDNRRAEAAIVADLRVGEDGRVTNPNLARFLAGMEYKRREARHFLGLEESAKHYPAADTVPIPAEDATLTPLRQPGSAERAARLEQAKQTYA